MGRSDPERRLFRGRAALPFDADAAVRALSARDKALGRVIERVGPFALKIEALHNPFSALCESICYQQLTGKAAATIFGRVCALYAPMRYPDPEGIVRTPVATLRAAGLSRAKTVALKDLAEKTLDGTVPSMRRLRSMSDEEIAERLTAVRGIGLWTVQMLLIFRLGRPDVLPTTDYGIRKGFRKTFRTPGRGAPTAPDKGGRREGEAEDPLPTPREIAERGERWRPWRSVASWYLWRSLE